MRQESGGRLYGRNGDLVTSGAGAMGLMQVMPATYDEIRARYPELGDDPYDPHNNIMAGTAYIREMYDIYGSPGFLAAYNAGPGRLDDYLTRNRTLPEETRRYVAAIGPKIAGTEPRSPSPGQQYAMNAVPFSIPDGPRYSAASRYSAPATGSFIRLAPQPDVPPIQMAAISPEMGSPTQLQPLAAPMPVQPRLAAAAPIVLRPQPIEVAEAEPLRPYVPAEPPRSFAQAEPQRPFVLAPMALPSRSLPPPVPMRGAVQMAQLPEPPAYAPPPRSQQQMAAAALVPVAPRGSGFFIRSANAEPIGMQRGGYASGGWAVQVGAFANEGLASSAAMTARDHARESLSGARSSVTAVHQPHGTLYRARLTGLSRDAAAQACERLSRARTTCMVVSPDAQS